MNGLAAAGDAAIRHRGCSSHSEIIPNLIVNNEH
jgi:hypothetical protein